MIRGLHLRTLVRRLLPGAVLAAAVAVCGATPGAARADRLDDRLNEQAPKIVEALHKKNYKNVGVLRFRVQQGGRPESFSVGSLNGNLVTRLENALIIHLGSDAQQAMGIIHDAGKTAAKQKVGDWYHNPAERKKLFDSSSYPLAWGNKTVKPDAFLTGVVKVAPDYKKASVTIESFSAANPKLEKVLEFNFDPDIPLLHDLGKSYSVARRGAAAKGGPALRNLIFTEVKKRDDGEGGNSGGDLQPTNQGSIEVGGIEFKLLSNNNPVPIKEVSEGDKKFQLECPAVGDTVIFSITNKTADKTLGVDVKLNGTSLLLEQSTPAESSRVWVLAPGKTFQLKGYYLSEADQKNVAPFKILVGDEARGMKETLGDKAGEIQVSVFEQGAAEPEMTISRNLRGPRPSQNKAVRADLGTLQRSLLKANALKREVRTVTEGGKVVKRELIVKDEDEEKRQTEALKVVDFQRAAAATASVTLRVVPRPE